MNTLVLIILVGWLPAVVLIFALLEPRRAVIVSFVGAWLFLPMAKYDLPILPDYTKMFATCVGALLGAAIFDLPRLLRLRLKWYDLPILIWCLVPLISSLTNGLGVYDGISGAMFHVVTWALPYFIGRVYFTDEASVRELAIGIFVGGLIYVPLCLYEIRMSPQLHHMLYGFHQQSFAQSSRFGGWRPMVFLEHGLMLGSWMASATLVGYWLWISGSLKKLADIDIRLLVAALLLTTLLCKSSGAVLLMAAGIAGLTFARFARTGLAIGALLLVPLAYIGLRTSGIWDGSHAVEMAEAALGADRAQSLEFRLNNETMLIDRALERPLFGWGGWGRSDIVDDYGNKLSVTDGLWIISLGKYGLIGLAALYAVLLISPLRIWLAWPGHWWSQKSVAATAVLAVLVVLYAIDCLPNGMNLFFMLCSGAVAAAARPDYVTSPQEVAIRQQATSITPKRRPWPAVR